MFRKKGAKLEKSLIDAGVDTGGNLGRTLLAKMVEHGMGNENIEIEVNQVYEFEIYRKGYVKDEYANNFLAYISRHNKSNLWDVAVVIIPNDGSFPYSIKEVVHSKYDLFGKPLNDV